MSADMPGPGGGPNGEGGQRDLGERIEAARASLEPVKRDSFAEKYNSLTLAWRMTLELVVGTAIGFGIGWGLDALFGTRPLFLICFGLLGVAAGVKVVMETASKVSRGGDVRASDEARDDEQR